MYSDYPKTVYTNKEKEPSDNYKGRAKKQENIQYGYRKIKSKEQIGFEKAKKKIKITIFNNGFFINYGPFRDKKIPENKRFIELIEKGILPKELIEKNGKNLGIILENRKNEEYLVTPISFNTQEYKQSNINNVEIKQNIYNNKYPNININKMRIEPAPTKNYNNLINTKPISNYPYQQQSNVINMNNLNIQNNKLSLNNTKTGNNKQNNLDNSFHDNDNQLLHMYSKTPRETRDERKDIFHEQNIDKENIEKELRKSFSRKKSKQFITFQSFIKLEKEKEDEDLKKKGLKRISNQGGMKEEKEKDKKDEKKFVAFKGSGYYIGNVNIEGLKVNKDFKNEIDKSIPVCHLNIRLFNGEIIECDFNITQKLQDVYIYVSQLSQSNNFVLLEGFPPKPLNELNKYIKDLKLDNTTLTQKIV